MGRRFSYCTRIVLPTVIALMGVGSIRADDAEDQYAVAAGHYAAQRWELAVDEFRGLIKEHPEDPKSVKSLFFLGEALVQLGKYDEAHAEFNRFLAGDPNSTYVRQALFRSGETAFLAGKRDMAHQALDDFRDKYPDDKLNAYVLMYLGQIALTNKDLAAAQSAFNEALRRFPTDPQLCVEAHYWLGLVCEAKADWTSASKTFAKALETDPKHPLAPQIRYHLADVQYRAGDFSAAIKTLEAAGAAADTSHVARGTADPQWLASRYLLALGYQGAKRDGEALAVLDALGHDADGEMAAKIQLARAASFIATGKFAAAADALGSYLKSQPSGEYSDRALAQLAVCQLQMGENAKAAATFDRLLERFPDGPAAAEAAWSRGQVFERLKKFDAALASYQLIVEKHASSKRFDDAVLAAGRLHNQLHQDSQAIELYQRLVRERPDSSQIDAARYGWAWALRDAGKSSEADEQFQKLHDTFRQSRFWNDATFRLAESAQQAKQSDRAYRLLDELLAAKPPPEIAQHALYLEGQVAAADQKWDLVATVMARLANEYPDSALRLAAEYWIAEAAYRQGRFDEAGKRFAALSDQIGGRKDKWLAMVPLRQAQVLAQQKQWADAHAIAVRIATDYPDFSEQYEVDYLLGRAMAAQADFDAARKSYVKVVRSPTGGKTETAAMAQWMIGESYFHQENYNAALREYLRVEILYPYPRWQAAALLQAGKCQESLGHWKDATESYARLIKVYSNTEFTEEATRRLHDAETHATAAVRKQAE